MDYRTIQDWIVGAASILIGMLFWYWAISNSDVSHNLKVTKFIAKSYGRGWSRAMCALIGTLLIALGIAIACGYSLELIG